MISIEERIANFKRCFPTRPAPTIHGTSFYTVIVLGQAFKKDRVKYYGAYPNNVLSMMLSFFPDVQPDRVCHLFSGTISNLTSITYDSNPNMHPTICDDIKNLEQHRKILGGVDLFLADPPYEKDDFKKYGCPYLHPVAKAKIVKSIAAIAKPRVFLGWLDTRVPIWARADWNLIGYICFMCGTASRIRVWTILQKK